jgi:2-methylcitrate synthase
MPDANLPDATAISSVEAAHGGLSYRGYAIGAWSVHGNYEQIAYLLLYGELPDARALRAFTARVVAARELPPALRHAVEGIPAVTHPMAVLQGAVSMLGHFEPERLASRSGTGPGAVRVAERLLGAAPAALAHWYQRTHSRTAPARRGQAESVAGHLLRALTGRAADAQAARALDVSLMLYAEHAINASTFTARVIASTGADFYAAIGGALGALAGPLHGGANEAALRLLRRWRSVDEAVSGVTALLARGERIPGFGHRLYRGDDPRSAVHKALALQLAARADTPAAARRVVYVAEALERCVLERRGLHANVDLYAAALYHLLGIPPELCTPVFACARLAGWSAHILEQRADRRLIQPAALYRGPALKPWPDAGALRRGAQIV